MTNITHIVIHYSATARGQHITVADIDKWHKKRGWRGIGYHYVVYLDGSVHKGREENEIGAHVANQNTGKLGICYIGGTEVGKPDVGLNTLTPEQEEGLIRLIQDLIVKHPSALVVGHRDLAATQCPGLDIIPWWRNIQGGWGQGVTYEKVHEEDYKANWGYQAKTSEPSAPLTRENQSWLIKLLVGLVSAITWFFVWKRKPIEN